MTEALMPARATAETAPPGGSQIPKIKFTPNTATAFSVDSLNYVKGHAARAVVVCLRCCIRVLSRCGSDPLERGNRAAAVYCEQ